MAINTSAKAILPPAVAAAANLADRDPRQAVTRLSEVAHNPAK